MWKACFNDYYHRSAVLIGVVRQAVKRSAGSSGFMGSSSFVLQAASWMQFFVLDADPPMSDLLPLIVSAIWWNEADSVMSTVSFKDL